MHRYSSGWRFITVLQNNLITVKCRTLFLTGINDLVIGYLSFSCFLLFPLICNTLSTIVCMMFYSQKG